MKLVNGHWLCKRHTPFPLADEAWVDETGQWGPKRCYGYFNNFCSPLLQSVRANHDIKLITNGTETKHIGWYITHYVDLPARTQCSRGCQLSNGLIISKQSIGMLYCECLKHYIPCYNRQGQYVNYHCSTSHTHLVKVATVCLLHLPCPKLLLIAWKKYVPNPIPLFHSLHVQFFVFPEQCC